MIGEVRANSLVAAAATARIAQAMRTGHLNDQGAALSRLLSGVNGTRAEHRCLRARRRRGGGLGPR